MPLASSVTLVANGQCGMAAGTTRVRVTERASDCDARLHQPLRGALKRTFRLIGLIQIWPALRWVLRAMRWDGRGGPTPMRTARCATSPSARIASPESSEAAKAAGSGSAIGPGCARSSVHCLRCDRLERSARHPALLSTAHRSSPLNGRTAWPSGAGARLDWTKIALTQRLSSVPPYRLPSAARSFRLSCRLHRLRSDVLRARPRPGSTRKSSMRCVRSRWPT